MINCRHCNGYGYQEWYEDNRLVRDACYRCGTTGKISGEMLRETILSAVASTLASWKVKEMEDYCNSNPDGEGWAFRAAEEMMSPREYSDSWFYHHKDICMEKLYQMSDEDQELMIAWMDSLQANP